MRRVLESKLVLDGLDWTSDTFKNQAYNLQKRRLGLLRHHVAYKTLAILTIMAKRGEGGRFVMIGDNAESDPLVYGGVARLLEGRCSVSEFESHLVNAGVQSIEIAQIMPVAAKVHGKGSVSAIFIRKFENIYSTKDVGLHCLDWIFLIMDGRSRASKVEYSFNF